MAGTWPSNGRTQQSVLNPSLGRTRLQTAGANHALVPRSWFQVLQGSSGQQLAVLHEASLGVLRMPGPTSTDRLGTSMGLRDLWDNILPGTCHRDEAVKDQTLQDCPGMEHAAALGELDRRTQVCPSDVSRTAVWGSDSRAGKRKDQTDLVPASPSCHRAPAHFLAGQQ